MAARRDYVAIATRYAEQVVAGEITAGKWARLACQRQLDDLARAEAEKDDPTPAWGMKFDEGRARTICKFIELLPHVKGKLTGQAIRLDPWQCFILTTVFGWIRPDKTRRFRTVYISVPRKNTKSTLSAGVALFMLALTGEGGAEVYSAATKRDQARIVFNIAQQMARRTPEFRKRWGVGVGAHNIHQLRTGSKFEPLSAEGSTLDGLNVFCAVVDELHAHKTRTVFDVLDTAVGARREPLIWLITIAGSDRAGICYEQQIYVERILEGKVEDDTYFGIVYGIDEGDDWTDPAVWRKANPSFGISVSPDDLAAKCHKAQQLPSAKNSFLTRHLNVWVNADSAWMDMDAWSSCADPELVLEDFEGEPCLLALDLASKIDIAALTALFQRQVEGETHYYGFGRYYLPESAVEGAVNSQYEGWEQMGRLVATPGNIIDFAYIESDLQELARRFEIQEVNYDPFQATQFSTRMAAEGFPMVEVRSTVLNFSEPMKELEAVVMARRFHHDGCPVLTWMISNVVCHRDQKDNIYPRKERPELKIDGVISLLMTMNRALKGGPKKPSVYEKRGLLTV